MSKPKEKEKMYIFIFNNCGNGNKYLKNVLRHIKHIIKHGCKKPRQEFKCDKCNQSFTYKCQLNLHQKVHTKQNQQTCPNCKQIFRRKYIFNNSVCQSEQIVPTFVNLNDVLGAAYTDIQVENMDTERNGTEIDESVEHVPSQETPHTPPETS